MRVTVEGRKDALKLRCPQKDVYRLDKACFFVMKDLEQVAEVLDQRRKTTDFSTAVKLIQQKIDQPKTLASARIINSLSKDSYITYFNRLASHHRNKILAINPDPKLQDEFAKEAAHSLLRQESIESEGPNYQQYLNNFLGIQ